MISNLNMHNKWKMKIYKAYSRIWWVPGIKKESRLYVEYKMGVCTQHVHIQRSRSIDQGNRIDEEHVNKQQWRLRSNWPPLWFLSFADPLAHSTVVHYVERARAWPRPWRFSLWKNLPRPLGELCLNRLSKGDWFTAVPDHEAFVRAFARSL